MACMAGHIVQSYACMHGCSTGHVQKRGHEGYKYL